MVEPERVNTPRESALSSNEAPQSDSNSGSFPLQN